MEQTETAAQAKALRGPKAKILRRLTRIHTPATLTGKHCVTWDQLMLTAKYGRFCQSLLSDLCVLCVLVRSEVPEVATAAALSTTKDHVHILSVSTQGADDVVIPRP